MRLTARAPGKLILFGEYAVLAGAPAVTAAIDRYARVTVTTLEDGPWTVGTDVGDGGPWSVTVGGDGRDRLVVVSPPQGDEVPWIVRAVEETLHGHGTSLTRLPPLAIEAQSADLFEGAEHAKLGLGSSAAVVVALGTALGALLAQREGAAYDVSAKEALARLLDVHHRLQQGGSGVDVATSFHGGVVAFRRDPRTQETEVERIALPAGLHLACVWTGRATSTGDFLERVRAAERHRPAAYAESMTRLTALANEALRACRDGRAGDVVPLAQAYHDAMAGLGETCGIPIVSEAHGALARLAAGSGAAYKPSGAGGGDVGVLLAADADALGRATDAARAAGYRILDFALAETGVGVFPS